MACSFAYCTTACASGCSLFASSDAAICTSVFSSVPKAATSLTRMLPSVIVPVLSSTTQSALCAVSNAAADLIRIPFSAPFPVATIMATGVASPSAHGHEITSTAIPVDSANSNPCPSKSHTTKLMSAIPMTIGTNTPLILSASLAIGALELAASCTSSMILAIVVSAPTRVAVNCTAPLLLIVAAISTSPAAFSTGTLSPVIADSSTTVVPDTTVPSTGMLCPGFKSTVSPTTISSSPTTTSFPSRRTVADFGVRSISFLIASPVFPFDFASKYFPSVISVRIVPADSKYISML